MWEVPQIEGPNKSGHRTPFKGVWGVDEVDIRQVFRVDMIKRAAHGSFHKLSRSYFGGLSMSDPVLWGPD